MNIAMAVKTPLVAIGCTSPEDWGPYGPMHVTVNAVRSRDSYTEGERREAMDSISVDEVWGALTGRWSTVSSQSPTLAS
jgi:ADP-heptose:LPS heptosyltransferase